MGIYQLSSHQIKKVNKLKGLDLSPSDSYLLSTPIDIAEGGCCIISALDYHKVVELTTPEAFNL